MDMDLSICIQSVDWKTYMHGSPTYETAASPSEISNWSHSMQICYAFKSRNLCNCDNFAFDGKDLFRQR